MTKDHSWAFYDLAEHGTLAEIQEYYEQHKPSIKVNWKRPDRNQHTPLMRAAARGDVEIVQWLLEVACAEVNQQNFHGTTALLCACFDHPKVVKVLLQHGANSNQADKTGWTPLLTAAVGQNREAVEILLKNGADIHMTTGMGKSAYEYAKIWDYAWECFKCLWLIGHHRTLPTARTATELWNRITAEERETYAKIWRQATKFREARLDAQTGVSVIENFGLSARLAEEIWELSSKGKQYLNITDFGLVMRYVLVAQRHGSRNKHLVWKVEHVLLPRYNLKVYTYYPTDCGKISVVINAREHLEPRFLSMKKQIGVIDVESEIPDSSSEETSSLADAEAGFIVSQDCEMSDIESEDELDAVLSDPVLYDAYAVFDGDHYDYMIGSHARKRRTMAVNYIGLAAKRE